MKPLLVAIAGLGTVGAGVVNLLQNNQQIITTRAGRSIVLAAVSARDQKRSRACNLNNIPWYSDAQMLAQLQDVDVLVELIGGAEGTAAKLVISALQHGKHVVTANKALLARQGVSLAELAEASGKQLRFEAAIAGGIPVVKTLGEALVANQIKTLRGILNGTCNYVLTRMQKAGLDFAEALKEAQAAGYAEADPTMDIGGFDTAHKITLLAALAFGVQPNPDSVIIEALSDITPLDMKVAAELGYCIKMLGVASFAEHGLEQRAEPCLVPNASPLSKIDDVINALLVEANPVGDVLLSGAGAGAGATASAVVADLIDIARGLQIKPFGVPASSLNKATIASPETHISCWYLRLKVKDQPGVVADIAAILRDEKVSIQSLLQRAHGTDSAVPVIIITHQVNYPAMQRAMHKIATLPAVAEKPCWLRIEEA